MIRRHLCVLLLVAGTLWTSTATAQELGVRAFGLRTGINMNPDQFNFGVHFDAGSLTRSLRLQPSFELGIGNGVRLGAANFDAHYLFSPTRTLRPYAGGGLGVNFIDVTNGIGRSGLDLEPVLNLVGGVEWGAPRPGSRASRRYLLEARIGMGDTPDLKLVAGFSF